MRANKPIQSAETSLPAEPRLPGSGPDGVTVTGIPAAGTTCSASEGTSPVGYTESDECSSVSLDANGSASPCTFYSSSDCSGDGAASSSGDTSNVEGPRTAFRGALPNPSPLAAN